MVMYSIEPYIDMKQEVQPASIVYSLPTFHPRNGSVSSEEMNKTESDPRIELEQKQMALIDELNELVKRLNTAMSHDPNLKRKPSPHSKPPAPQSAPKQKTHNAAPVQRAPFSFHNELTESVVVGQSLRPCLPPCLVKLVSKRTPKMVSVTVAECDHALISDLAQLAVHRGVSFKGDVTNKCSTKPICTVEVTINSNGLATAKAVVDGSELEGRIVVWKLLGAVLGIYSDKPGCALTMLHMDRWLQSASQLLEGKMSSEEAYRMANPTLSRWDYLSSSSAATLSDVVMRAVVATNAKSLPNNVEMWMDRVAQAMV